LIEAKRSAFTDDSEFSGEPIEHPVIQFVMFCQDSQIVKGWDICSRKSSSHVAKAIRRRKDAMEMAVKYTTVGHENRPTIASQWLAVYAILLSR
jgi:hypothetical protein